jgi:glyoxylase-like metal-dependent hydrolase (beta-lactamase superfamily II)/ferredoxin
MLGAMARRDRRHPGNAAGDWFVDTSCIDCDACRQCAPDTFGLAGGQSIVVRQPRDAAEQRAAALALLVCPTGSIGTTGAAPDLAGVVPWEIDGGVYLCGHNSQDSYGATSFLAVRPEGNVMVDAPRWVPSLADRLAELGGLSHVLLTHRDDVADAARYAERFGARVWIHELDARAAPFAEGRIAGTEPVELRPGLRAIPVPGHTRGSVVFLLEDRFLFTGDSLHFSRELGDLSAFDRQCWYSWEEQTRSLERLESERFEWVLAGHGDRRRATPEENRASLVRLVERMRRRDERLGDW